jgi:hypothetical protein
MPPAGPRVVTKIVLRAFAALVIAALAVAARFAPATRLTDGGRWSLVAIAVAIGIGWVLAELL